MIEWFGPASHSAYWLLLTLAVYGACSYLSFRWRIPIIFHPVIVSLSLLILAVDFQGASFSDYMQGGQYLVFLLGPATVALAIPLFDQWTRIRRNALPILIACAAGAFTASASALALGLMLGLDKTTLLSLAPKSVTSPIAIGVAETLGGYPSLAAGLVLMTGAIGCALGPLLFRLLNIHDPAAQGFALGVAAHGFGTAQAFTFSQTAGAFAGLAMGLCGVMTAFFLPALVGWMGIS